MGRGRVGRASGEVSVSRNELWERTRNEGLPWRLPRWMLCQGMKTLSEVDICCCLPQENRRSPGLCASPWVLLDGNMVQFQGSRGRAGKGWLPHPTGENGRPSLTALQVTWCPWVPSPLGPDPLIRYTVDESFTVSIIYGPWSGCCTPRPQGMAWNFSDHYGSVRSAVLGYHVVD